MKCKPKNNKNSPYFLKSLLYYCLSTAVNSNSNTNIVSNTGSTSAKSRRAAGITENVCKATTLNTAASFKSWASDNPFFTLPFSSIGSVYQHHRFYQSCPPKGQTTLYSINLYFQLSGHFGAMYCSQSF